MSDQSSTVTRRLAEVAAAEGCEHIFTLMGAGNLWLINALADEHGVGIHHLRHENGAIGAADGYARATGRVGWATVTQGPGFTNTVTALLTAARAGTPLVAIVSDSSNLDPARFPFAGGIQAIRPETLMEPLGIDVVRGEGEDAPRRLREAAALARTGRTVVFAMPAGLDRISTTLPIPPAMSLDATPPAVDEAAVARAAGRLATATRPVIVAGRGVVIDGAADEVMRLSTLLGAPITTSVPAAGAVGDAPAVIGFVGGFAVDAAERELLEADAIIAIGVGLNVFQTRKGTMFPTASIVVCIDLDPGVADDQVGSATDVVVGGARAGTAALVDALTELIEPRSWPPVTQPEPIHGHDADPGLLDPRDVCARLERVLPQPRRVVVDNGHFGAFPILGLRHTAPRSLMWLPDFGAVGSALGAAIASSIADPLSTTVLFIGDCGFYMTMGDLETAVRERLPMVVVCMNDGAAGSEIVHMQDWGAPIDQAVFGYADIAAAAAGMGCQAALVTDLDQLDGAIAGWRSEEGPLFIDCHLSRVARSPIYAHV